MFLTQPPPSGAGEPLEAVALLKKGIEKNPGAWKLYQVLGFVYYMELKDYLSAGKAFEEGSKIPGAHPFLKAMAAKTLQKGGDYEVARMLWQVIYETSNDSIIREGALKHLLAMQVDLDVSQLERLVQIYASRTGHLPSSFAELGISTIPRDPLGYPYVLLPDGHVQVKFYRKLPFIKKGLPPGEQPSEMDLSTMGK